MAEQVGMWGEGGPGTSGGSVSRSCPLHRPESAAMAADALKLVRAWSCQHDETLSLSAMLKHIQERLARF